MTGTLCLISSPEVLTLRVGTWVCVCVFVHVRTVPQVFRVDF